MSGAEARAALVGVARRLVADGLCVGTAGNASVRHGDDVLITPSGVAADRLTVDDVAAVGPDGEVRSARCAPSSELPLHLAVYAATGATAVVHTHSPYATALSTVVEALPAVHYTINALGGPVRVAPYATFGTPELARHVQQALVGRSAAILANHGTVTCGPSLEVAYDRAVLLEWLATLYWRARQVGEPRILTGEELAAVDEQGRRLGYAPLLP